MMHTSRHRAHCQQGRGRGQHGRRHRPELVRGDPLRESVLFGVAVGSAAVMTPGTELCRREDAERLYEIIIIIEVLFKAVSEFDPESSNRH